ncbi:MAG: hypothetical protein ABJM37_00005, partial [Gilvibacter sp.]
MFGAKIEPKFITCQISQTPSELKTWFSYCFVRNSIQNYSTPGFLNAFRTKKRGYVMFRAKVELNLKNYQNPEQNFAHTLGGKIFGNYIPLVWGNDRSTYKR